MLQLGPILSVTLAPLVPLCGGTVQRALECAAECGARSVQLSAAQKGLRPRELDRQGRRELLGLIARRGLMLGGLDLMIAHKEFLDGATQDRAVGAVAASLSLAADLGRVPLSLSLPIEKLPGDITQTVIVAAEGQGVPLALHAEHNLEALDRLLAAHDHPLFGAGLDPAALISLGHDPVKVATRLAPRLLVARLDDHARTAVNSIGGRCPMGEGELDVTDYRAALAIATHLRGLVVELRDLPDPIAGLRAAVQEWRPDRVG